MVSGDTLELGWKEVRRFHAAAWMHQEAAEFLMRGCNKGAFSTRAFEAIYLGGYAVECIFKALLLSQVRPKRHVPMLKAFVKEIGHDLEMLKQRLEGLRKPVLIPSDQLRQLRLVRRMWATGMRYDPQPRRTEDAQQFMDAVSQLLSFACGV